MPNNEKTVTMQPIRKNNQEGTSHAYQNFFLGIRFLLLMSIVLVLTACAAQQAAREGKLLMSEGKIVEGLEKLQQASNLDRSNPQYRIQYLNMRDTVINAALTQADQALAAKRYADAQSSYKQALALDSNNSRATDGLREVEQAKRHDNLLAEALSSWNKKDSHTATVKLKQILGENP